VQRGLELQHRGMEAEVVPFQSEENSTLAGKG
jgi:hypothetical protein